MISISSVAHMMRRNSGHLIRAHFVSSLSLGSLSQNKLFQLAAVWGGGWSFVLHPLVVGF